MAILKFLFSFLLIIFVPGFAIAANCNAPNSIVRISNSASGGFEYVSFKYKKPPVAPTFAVTNVVPPFIEDGSGNTVIVPGAHWTQVMFRNMDWMCTIPKFITVRPAVKAVKSIGQFEGQITYVIGRSVASHYISTQKINVGAFTMIRVKLKP